MIIFKKYGLRFKYFLILTIIIIANFVNNINISAINSNVEKYAKEDKKNDSLNIKKRAIYGKIISLDTMPAPRRVLAGNPRIVPFNDFTFDVKYPKTVYIPKKQTIITPGKNSFPEPNVYKVQIEDYRFIYPEANTILSPKMKYGANGYTKHYSKTQGIGGGKMYKIVQDKDENLWFMDHDLVKFDGTHVMRFTHIINKDKEKTHFGLHDIIEDSKGNLWFLRGSHIIPTNRIMRYDGNTIKVITALDETGNPMAWRYTCIYEDTFGNFWIGSMFTGLLKYEPTGQDNPNGKFIHFTKECGLPGDQISCITGSINRNLWIGTQDAGIYKYEHGSEEYPNGRFIQFSTKDGLSSNHITSITEADDGKLWIGTYNEGVNIFDGTYFSRLSVNEGLSHNLINYLYEDRSNNIWIATHGGGVCKFEESSSSSNFGKLTYFNADNLFFSNYILSIVEDSRGCMWFGSFGGSLTMYDPNSFNHINTQSGMDIEFVSSPCEDKDGNIWFGDDRGGGICKFDGRSFSYYTREQGLACDSIASLIVDSDNNIWIATTGGGVCKFDGRYFTYYTEENGINSNFINCLTEDSRGNIWIGTEHHGACKLMDDKIVSYTMNEGLCDDFIYCLYEDKKQNMWIGTEKGGVDKFDGKYITNFNKDNGILHNQVVSVLEDKRGDIWFGVSFRGFFRYDAKARDSSQKFIQLTYKPNHLGYWRENQYRILNGPGVCFLKEDNEGNMWLANRGGLHLLSIPKNGDLHKMLVYDFTTLDGKSEDNSVFNSPLITRSNRFYWGQGNSLSYLDLDNFHPPSDIPVQQITGIDLEQTHIDFRKLAEKIKEGFEYNIGPNKDINLNKVKFSGVFPESNLPIDLRLPYYLNYLTFHFTAIEWEAPHKLLYQYKLEGSDKDWRKVTKETKGIYTSLSPGKYTFKVKAIGATKEWSQVAEYSFYIHPPWWFTWWAYMIYILIILALVYIWHRDKLNHQRLMLNLKSEQIQTEQKIFAERQINKLQREKHLNEIEYKNKELGQLTLNIIDKNNILLKIKELLKNDTGIYSKNTDLYSYVCGNIDFNQNWYQFKQLFEESNPGFINKLSRRYPVLTDSEIKLCTYLKTKLSSKEVAQLMHITEIAVNKKRNRLRKKLNLQPKEDLHEWLNSI